jgi:hypothetical protein
MPDVDSPRQSDGILDFTPGDKRGRDSNRHCALSERFLRNRGKERRVRACGKRYEH